MSHNIVFRRGFFGLLSCLLLSSCFIAEDRVSGPSMVHVNEIDFMQSGGRLYLLDSSGVAADQPSFFFRATSSDTTQLWTWEKDKSEWTEFTAITSYVVPSGDYFIGRYRFDGNFAYFAFTFTNDDEHLKYFAVTELEPVTGLTWASSCAV